MVAIKYLVAVDIKMDQHFLLIIIFMCINTALSITVRKFVYQKDMSEYCKRRVVPSVFLGRHVVEAHSQVLHFSRMELPYSCFISVRAESGSNVVLVVQLLAEQSLVKACTESPSQLLVYEMGETFGGYWGPLPESVIRPEPTEPTEYTLKTTEHQETRNLYSDYYEEKKETDTTYSEEPKFSENEQDFIRVEVPIVNVSGRLVPGEEPLQSAFDDDEIFDLLYDVTPRAKQQYKTSILPVVQFLLNKPKDGRQEDTRYNFELKVPYYSERTTRRKSYVRTTNYYVNRLLNFKETKSTKLSTNNFLRYKYSTSTMNIDNVMDSTLYDTNTYEYKRTENIKTWEEIKEIMRNLNESTSHVEKFQNDNKNVSRFLDEISNMKYNGSVYLLPHWDLHINNAQSDSNNQINTFTKRVNPLTKKSSPSTFSTKNIQQISMTTKPSIILHSSRFSTMSKETTNISEDIINKTTIQYNKQTISTANKHNTLKGDNTSLSTLLVIKTLTNDALNLNIVTKSISTDVIKPQSGTMVDHESWENVVQAAPVMAKLLNTTVVNQHVNDTRDRTTQLNGNHTDEKYNGNRIKRKIYAIAIENARPHNLTTREVTATTSATSYGIADMQEFAQLVELQDDEVHERVALRYLRQYAGPMLFNMCDFAEPKVRHVYLFNSSRIVLAVHNFTLDRMTVILTPARTLLSGNSRCSSTSLECQVFGTRICIDSMNACDGVPNCGAYDIYDEDRLMCGAAVGLQHNVYLAAITFLAVLLTLMYAVHYWIRRCVPKVSEAFFVYTDGTENILYLESIMRSPHDIDETPKMTFYANVFEDEEYLYPKESKKSGNNIFRRIFRGCFRCCKRRDKILSNEFMEAPLPLPKKMFSFAEMELSKMMNQNETTDVAVQTGGSLELSRAETKRKNGPVKNKSPPTKTTKSRRMAKVAVTTDDHVNELNMLKFFKELKYDQGTSAPHSNTIGGQVSRPEGKLVEEPSFEEEEEELQTHIYEYKAPNELPGPSHRVITTACDLHSERPKASKQTEKRLRFEEETTTIPPIAEEYDIEDDEDLNTVGRTKKGHNTDKLDKSPSKNIGEDFKRFWKGKKSRKKAHLALH